MPNLTLPNHQVVNITPITVIVGRNGSGKSRFLRSLDTEAKQGHDHFRSTYISPEPNGIFEQDSGIEQAINNNINWVAGQRNRNQSENFRKVSATYLKALELNWLRKMENDSALRHDTLRTFETEYLDKMNDLFINVRIIRDRAQKVFSFETYTGDPIEAGQLSSGESEVVTLTSEILYFFSAIDSNKTNLLLIDEPDVHLHPDLQVRFGRFLIRLIQSLADNQRNAVKVIIVTHSTALISGLSDPTYCSIAPKLFGNDVSVNGIPIGDEIRKSAAFFAHPLSQVLALEPILIVEGEDDVRVLQQAARTSLGRIKVFPCLADSVQQMSALETFCSKILPAVYDNPIGFSLRDGDGITNSLQDIGCIKRFRLQCYAIENLLLTDECLTVMNSTWNQFIIQTQAWCSGKNPQDQQVVLLQAIIASPNRHRHIKIKDVRVLICAILGVTKPWEVVVGQALGNLPPTLPNNPIATSAVAWIGLEVLKAIGLTVAPPQATNV
ncbi:AAA family ATPase [Chryseolinea sp. T2]|uniref:AAA family ATPase n=1 Tax=Chryseolinea sp. T2 TaxID=3129255 RepID=UPI003078520C